MELTFDAREFFAKTKRIITKPNAFYRELEHEKGWKDAFTYSIIISVLAAIFGILSVTLLSSLFGDDFLNIYNPADEHPLLSIIPAFFVSAVIVIALGFVWSWVVYSWLKLWKMKGSYWHMYKAYTYSRAPISLFGWVPLIRGLFGLYSVILFVIGLSTHYKIGKLKAFLLLVPPMIFLFLIQTLVYTVMTQMQP